MKPIERKTVMHYGNLPSEQQVDMTVDSSAMAHIMNVLTDLYSNPILAIIREYSTNAFDANVEAGYTGPVEVSLPAGSRPSFSVVDHGEGMDIDDIRNIYSRYGASTKRASNDVVGMLGLGCKSGLTYSSQFNIIGRKNGVTTTTQMSKNDQGAGSIKILETRPMTAGEHSGVTIEIPIKRTDLAAFKETATNFFAHWEPGTVLVDGLAPKFLRDDNSAGSVWVDKNILVVQGGGGYRYSRRPQITIVMGNVPYPVEFDDASLMNYGITAWVPIGSVTFPPSRESLMDTEDTRETVRLITQTIKGQMAPQLMNRVDSFKSNWKRMLFLHNWRHDRHLNQQFDQPTPAMKAKYPDWMFSTRIPVPNDRVVYQYEVAKNKASRLTDPGEDIRWQYLSDEHVPVITHFPDDKVKPSVRPRIIQKINSLTSQDRGVRERAIILPDTITDVSFVDSRPNVFTWNEVLATTDEPPKRARGTAPKKTTVYSYWVDGDKHGDVDFQPGDPLLVTPVNKVAQTRSQHLAYGQPPMHPGFGDIEEYSGRYSSARFVSLGDNQIDKFKRNHPFAEDYDTYIHRVDGVLFDSLTVDEHLRFHLTNLVPHSLRSGGHPRWPLFTSLAALAKNVPSFNVDDPRLQRIIALVLQGKDSPNIAEVRKRKLNMWDAVSAVYDAPKLGLAKCVVDADRMHEQTAYDYPILQELNNEIDAFPKDLSIYLNAKYHQSVKMLNRPCV